MSLNEGNSVYESLYLTGDRNKCTNLPSLNNNASTAALNETLKKIQLSSKKSAVLLTGVQPTAGSTAAVK